MKNKILYFIQLPPPIHGVSLMNKVIYRSEMINRGLEKDLLEIKFSNRLDQLRRVNTRKILQFFRIALDLAGRLRKSRPDYVYFSIMPVGKGFWRDFVFVIIIKAFGVKKIYHLHNRGIASNAKNPFMRQLYRFIFKNSCVIHLSEGLMKGEIDMLQIKNLRQFVVPNGVKDKKQKKSGEKGMVNLLYLSNLFPQKGVFDLIEIVKELAGKYDHIHLNIVGGFPYASTHAKVVNRIKELGLGSRISLLGPRYGKHKNREYRKAHMFVFPTSFRQECFPLVILEAMSFGLPVVASGEGAIPEILENGTDGYVVSLENRSEFTGRIEDLILDKDLREQLGSHARKKFLEKYTVEMVEERIREIFENEILN